MHDFDLVHGVQANDCLDEDLPDLTLFNVCLLLLVLTDLLKDITVVSQFHNNAKNKRLRNGWIDLP